MEAAAATPVLKEMEQILPSATVDSSLTSQTIMPKTDGGAGEVEHQPNAEALHQPRAIDQQQASSESVDQPTSQMDVDQDVSSTIEAGITADVVAQAALAYPVPAVPEIPPVAAMQTTPTLPETIVAPTTAAPESAMDAVIFDVSETPSVLMPSRPTDEQLSPLHRMAEIALATSPIMSNGVINRGNEYRKDGSMVLPSQQYYGTASSLYVPPSRSARERHEYDASRALSHAGSASVYPSSYPPSSSHSDPHPFGYRSNGMSHPAMTGKRRSSADDSSAHRYTHSRLQPKNKSPPSFQVVQLRSGTSDGSGEGVSHQQSLDFAKSESAPQETSPTTNQAYLEQPSSHNFSHESWQGSESAAYAARHQYPHPSYTDPIPHAQIHTYQPPGSHSNATSPVMNHQHTLPPPQTQNRLSIYDLVAAAEAESARETEHEQQASIKHELAHEANHSPPVDSQQPSASTSTEKKPKQKKASKRKNTIDKSANDQVPGSGSVDSPSVPPKNHKRKEKEPAADTGIVGHIPLRENSRSISKLLWAEPGAKALGNGDGPAGADDQMIPEDDEDIMPEDDEPAATDLASKGKKRQSNGALKPTATTGKSGTAKGKGKKKVEEPEIMEGIVEEAESQPKKKGKKNVSDSATGISLGCLTAHGYILFALQDSSSRSKGKAANGQAKNRSGSIESSATVDRKNSKKSKSVQIDDVPEFHEAPSSRKGRVCIFLDEADLAVLILCSFIDLRESKLLHRNRSLKRRRKRTIHCTVSARSRSAKMEARW